MNPKQQKFVMAALGAVAAAVWAPRFFGGDPVSESSSQVALGPSEEEVRAMTLAVTGESSASSRPGTATGAGVPAIDLAPQPGTDARDGIAMLLEGLGNFKPSRDVRSLDDIASEWVSAQQRAGAGAIAAQASSGQTAPRVHSNTTVHGADQATMSGPAALDQFLAAHPFRGTVLFADDRVALLGPLALRVGDEALGGDVVVVRIDAQRLTLSHRGISRELALPPIRAVESQRGEGTTGVPGGPVVPAPIEAGSGAPAPTPNGPP